MNWRSKLKAHWRSALAGAGLCVVLGVLLLFVGGWPVYLSYDLLFLLPKPPPPDSAVIIYLDDQSFKELGQTNTANWDRNFHARLLDRLTEDQSRLIVFDVVFSEPGTPEANTNLARAIERNGKVVLAAALNHLARAQIFNKQALLPLPEFQEAAAGWGIAEFDMADSGPGRVARRYYETDHHPSLFRAAATVAGMRSARQGDRWLNYYGPAITLPNLSFTEVPAQPSGYFRDKFVFVGARPTTLRAKDEADQFRTPYTLWRSEFTPARLCPVRSAMEAAVSPSS